MENLSLLYPQGKEPKCQALGDAAVNDLSLDYVLSRVAKNGYEKNLLKGMMLQLESDPATIRYRRDVFEDIMRFPPCARGSPPPSTSSIFSRPSARPFRMIPRRPSGSCSTACASWRCT